jgi:hypothetical protein
MFVRPVGLRSSPLESEDQEVTGSSQSTMARSDVLARLISESEAKVAAPASTPTTRRSIRDQIAELYAYD